MLVLFLISVIKHLIKAISVEKEGLLNKLCEGTIHDGEDIVAEA